MIVVVWRALWLYMPHLITESASFGPQVPTRSREKRRVSRGTPILLYVGVFRGRINMHNEKAGRY